MAPYALGIDIGGTFTDLVVHDHASGRRFSHKELTTPDDPVRGVTLGLKRLLDAAALDPGGVGRTVHATTLFTNALIERRGARTGLITTAGFRDTLEIGRERKYELYDIRARKPAPLVPRDLRLEVAERIAADGGVRLPLPAGDVAACVDRLAAEGVTSVAIVFLHAYLNPAHEAEARRLVAARRPGMAVTASHEVAPEIREYERASTTVINAYIKPLANAYLDRMARSLGDGGVAAPFHLMLSNGGLGHVEEGKRAPVRLLESGPAAGALAAAHFGRDDGGGDLLAFDMGGTTAKLCLIDGGEPLVAYGGFEAAREKRFVEGSGLPVRISAIELIEIGAGGGSVAHADRLGLLKVGPRSAGSEPGPAAYGRGGTEPTVTDADFLLGYLDPEGFAGGAVAIDLDAARGAVARLADRLGLSPVEAAWGIHDVVNEGMAGAARVHLAERGRDPARYALLATGGAGPVHACAVARKLHLRRLICPPSAGVASALGLLVAPARADRAATIGTRLDGGGDLAALEAACRRLEDEARAVIAETGLDPATARIERLADGRFVGQGFELVVRLPEGPYDAGDPDAVRRRLAAAFEAAYREKFAYAPPEVPIELVNARVSVQAAVPGGGVAAARHAADSGGARRGSRQAYFAEAGGFVETAVYDRDRLDIGAAFDGPAIVEEPGSTLVVGPGARCRVAASGNIVVDLTG